MEISKIAKAHFIGIGGIGMSGLALILKKMNIKVSGSDLKESEITQLLSKEGIKVKIGHRSSNLDNDASVVVISSAISFENPEIIKARKLKIPIIKRAELLAILCKNKKTIAVAGTHGKTTTTSMISICMDYAGANSTNVIGGIFKNINSNIKIGDSDYFVKEADESDGTFLLYSPLVGCITNIDNDHMDYYGNMDKLKEAFISYANNIPFYGRAILCIDDKGVESIIENIKAPYYTYGLNKNATWQARNIENNLYGISYDLYFRDIKQERIDLKVFGLHNVRNSLAAFASVKYLGFSDKPIKEALENFAGVKRRIELVGRYKNILFYDDYGHHPTEIINTISAIKNFYPDRRIIVIFQPHRYTRTKILYKEFAKSFSQADIVYIMPIYGASEKPINGVTSDLILREMNKISNKARAYTRSLDLIRNIKDGDIVLSLGAGDVWKQIYEIKIKLEGLSLW